MAEAEIGALRVTLAMNTAEFERGARSAGDTVDGLGERFKRLGDTVTSWGFLVKAAMAAVAGVSINEIRKVISSMDDMSKTADRVHLPIEQFSMLRNAAQLAGVPLASFDSGMKTLADNLEKAARGDDMEMFTKTLAALGVTATDSGGKVRSVADVLQNVSSKFAGYEESAAKSSLANNLFGGSAEAMLPLLNQGAEGLRRGADEAKSFGLVMSSDAARAAAVFETNMRSLYSSLKSTGILIANEITPALATFSSLLVNAVKQINIATSTTGMFTDANKKLQIIVAQVGVAFETLWDVIGFGASMMTAQFKAVPVMFELAMKTALNAVASGMESIINTMVSGLQILTGAIDQVFSTGLSDKIRESLTVDFGRMGLDEAKTQLNALGEEMKRTADGASNAMSTMGERGRAAAVAVMEGWSTATEAAAERIPKATAPIVKATEEDTEAKKRLNEQIRLGVQLAKDIETPRETELRQLAALEAAHNAGRISAEAMGRAQVAAAATAQSAYAGLASNVAGSLSKLFENNKAVAIASALINTYESVTKALAAYPPPYSFIAAGAALAAGLAQVINIQKTSKSSSGGGGGGAGAGAAASAGAGAGGGETASAPQMLRVQGLTAGQMFSGESVRDLAAQLLKFQRDGGEVVLA